MKKSILLLGLLLLTLSSGCEQSAEEYETNEEEVIEKQLKGKKPPKPSKDKALKELEKNVTIYEAGENFVTFVDTEGVGKIAVQVVLPKETRYQDGAPLITSAQTFFTDARGFDQSLSNLSDEGFILVNYLWPGKSTPEGFSSEGDYDYGGEYSIKAFADVLAFMSGSKTNAEGYYLDQIIEIEPLYEHSGVYAFSHPGIAMVNAMALYADQLDNISYLVARENPTDDIFSSVELGFWEDGKRFESPLYSYEENYDPLQIEIDYNSAKYDFDLERAYFDLNNNDKPDLGDHVLGTRIPTMFGKRFYSIEMTKALAQNGLEKNWPEDLATPEEAEELWPFRTCVENYPLLEAHEDLHVMLVYSEVQHVQGEQDAPSVHQALDGYKNAGLWFRINPDEAYIREFEEGNKPVKYEEHPANTEPSDWANAGEWGYPKFANSAMVAQTASIIEMADRSYTNNWSEDLDEVIQY